MRTQYYPLRFSASVAATALLVSQLLPLPASAQDQPTGDPPARVGRLAKETGSVSFHGPGDTQWARAPLNYPVVQGDAFWTDANAQAVIEVSASRIAMAPQTELDMATLTDTALQATEPQGELYLNLRAGGFQGSYTLQTPRGLVTLAAPGRYGVVAGNTQDPTVITVVEGSAQIQGSGSPLDVGPGQAATLTGSDPFQGEVAPAQHDAFLTAMLNSERARPATTPTVAAAMPGGEDLSLYGSWSDSPVYGQVWYPEVAPDWVPYRQGSWAYVAPWGWTWVDSDPWGFAPFHYGRWAEVGGRWAWMPGNQPAPAYAPALVTFFGAGAIAGAGIGAALAEGHIGWLPLGPREPFRPWYPASEHYLQRVNPGPAGTPGMRPPSMIGGFVNAHAATVVPGSVLTGSRPVAPAMQQINPAQIAQVHPIVGQTPLRPTGATLGVTPVVARQLNLPPAAKPQAMAPGPAIHPMPEHPTAELPSGQHFLPPLRQPAAAGAERPFAAPPALRPPPAAGQTAQPSVIEPHRPPEAGPGVAVHPAPQPTNRPPGAVVQQPTPPVTFHTPPPAQPVVHAPQTVVLHPSPPPAQPHPAEPIVHAAQPTPVHTPPPTPQVHAAAPPPVAHTPPPEHNAQHKRPGEQ
jgi:hypothetical protein